MGVGFKNRKTPGVYVTELQAFPKSMVGVPTAVPAFIGYTKRADVDGKSALNVPVKIGSMVEFTKYFGGAPDVKYKLAKKEAKDLKNPADYDFLVTHNTETDPTKPATNATDYYTLAMDPTVTNFYLYNSMRFFYENGGGDCYVVSVGKYADALTKATLQTGLDIIHKEKGPTMLVMPDAVLLADADFKEIANNMLIQAKELQDRVAILDVPKDTLELSIDDTMDKFRKFLNPDNDPPSRLSYGIAYYPWLNTSVIGNDEITYTIIGKSDLPTLQTALEDSVADKYTGDKLTKVKGVIGQITTVSEPADVAVAEQDIVMVAPLLKNILTLLMNKMNLLPPSGSIAGVISSVDSTRGVWKAPANVNVNAVISPDVTITNEEQEDMNIPLDGKAVNAIRAFAENGIIIWGSRTLDGNSKDWRYVNIRRTLIYIEQSIKLALREFLFEANDASTWTAVQSMIEGWLAGLWEQGGLMGDKANDAFEVQVGLGSTMTPNDILDGYMIVQVVLQMVHPVEFIELTFKQQMSG